MIESKQSKKILIFFISFVAFKFNIVIYKCFSSNYLSNNGTLYIFIVFLDFQRLAIGDRERFFLIY